MSVILAIAALLTLKDQFSARLRGVQNAGSSPRTWGTRLIVQPSADEALAVDQRLVAFFARQRRWAIGRKGPAGPVLPIEDALAAALRQSLADGVHSLGHVGRPLAQVFERPTHCTVVEFDADHVLFYV